MRSKIELGCTAEDTITGQSGVVVGVSEWLTGCSTVGIQPKMKEDGTLPDVHWVDEVRVRVKKKSGFKKEGELDGGPKPSPRQPNRH